ncbi:endospore germination permease [Ammoniphilus sp. YIM 78166]|uniref:GerAB/ArcD/ProY family transporter n=1 Tax=Ammoniphilus sp. YIM 78166 TaxID=1644106 RepID=UPI00142F640C|nr:endospore germination permease [Ammoniphilus sp. YIM 78166]
MENGKINARHFFLLSVFFIIGTAILTVPSWTAPIAKQDAWMAVILGVIVSFLVMRLYIFLAKQMKEHTLVEYSQKVLGKWFGGLVSLWFILFSLLMASALVYYVGNFMVTQIMQETPIQFINASFVLIVLMGIRLGLETIGRAAEILVPWFLLMYLITVLSVLPEVDLHLFQPVFENGMKPIVFASFSYISISGFAVVVLLMFYPANINREGKKSKFLLHAAWVGGLFTIAITIVTLLILGPDQAGRQIYPTYTLAKKISIGDFLQRVEALVAAMWVLTLYFKTTFYFFASIKAVAQLLKLQSYRTLTYPMGMILITLSLIIYPNTVYMNYWDSHFFVPYALTVGLGIPVLLLAVGSLQKRYEARKNQA